MNITTARNIRINASGPAVTACDFQRFDPIYLSRRRNTRQSVPAGWPEYVRSFTEKPEPPGLPTGRCAKSHARDTARPASDPEWPDA